ncbi:MAG TPA: S41 family peptidase [Pyrinomonadaceae bacterium]|nr:S41 family peptidase [Pyrinomonadaceae bacterium]
MRDLAAKIRSTALFALLPLMVLCGETVAQQPAASPAAAASPSPQSDLSKRQESFQIVWQTVNDLFYDPKFGGVDWLGVRKTYEPRVAKAKSDQEFHELLQQMLNELHQSHFLVVPREAIPKIRLAKEADDDADKSSEDAVADVEEPLDELRYKLTDRLLTGIGIDLRVIDGSAVVTRVDPGSSAARAGLRPGYVIKSVGRQSLDSLISEIERHPLWGAIIRPELPLFLVAGFINGDEMSRVKLGYLDARKRLRTISIRRERLKGEMSPAVGNLPAMYTEFEARQLRGGIGYIRFTAFVPSLMERLCRALRTMRNAPGIIIDLRGNRGGLLGMIGGLTGLLETNPTSMGTMRMRNGLLPIFVFPQSAPYSGPLVIMVDGSTESAAEMFAAGLQETGRAVIVGEQSAGNTLPSAIMKLPTDAIFQYGVANFETMNGKELEGKGVNPDMIVKLNRRSLLYAGDPQLSAALSHVRAQIRGNLKPRELIADVTVTSPPPAPAESKTGVHDETKKVEDSPFPTAGPPPRPINPPVVVDSSKSAGLPSAEAVFEKYLKAIGGRAAFEKITNRVSTGTVELAALATTGTVEIVEQSPNKSSLIINAPGVGVIQRTFDGRRAWLQDPLRGLIRFTGNDLKMAADASVFNRQAKLRELYPSAVVKRKEKLGARDVFLVQTDLENWYFDAEDGLLLRMGNIYFDDYREVDGVRLPFKIRENVFSGFELDYQFKEIRQNVKIDEAKFTEYPSCLTSP